MVPPSGNIIVKVLKCVWHAGKVKSKERLTKPRYHLLDYAEPKYGKQMVYDIKCLLKILILYVPFPLFWALFDQQSSRWTFQATQMNGTVAGDLTIKPDQMQVVNPVIVVFCIPLFNFVIYPMLEKVRINTPLRKMALGMLLCGAAFAMSGILELELEKTYPVLPREHESQVRIFNGQSCDFHIETTLPGHPHIHLRRDAMWADLHVPVPDGANGAKYRYNLTSVGTNCDQVGKSGEFEIAGGIAASYVLTSEAEFLRFDEGPHRSKSTIPLVRVIMASVRDEKTFVVLQKPDGSDEHTLEADYHKLHEVDSGRYVAWIDSVKIHDGPIALNQGGNYELVVNRHSTHNYVCPIFWTFFFQMGSKSKVVNCFSCILFVIPYSTDYNAAHCRSTEFHPHCMANSTVYCHDRRRGESANFNTITHNKTMSSFPSSVSSSVRLCSP